MKAASRNSTEKYMSYSIVIPCYKSSHTIRELRALAEDHDYVTAVCLAHNGGQHNALICGLNYADGDVIIFMDDDGQTHPSQLETMLGGLDDDHDVVYGYYDDSSYSARPVVCLPSNILQ